MIKGFKNFFQIGEIDVNCVIYRRDIIILSYTSVQLFMFCSPLRIPFLKELQALLNNHIGGGYDESKDE